MLENENKIMTITTLLTMKYILVNFLVFQSMEESKKQEVRNEYSFWAHFACDCIQLAFWLLMVFKGTDLPVLLQKGNILVVLIIYLSDLFINFYYFFDNFKMDRKLQEELILFKASFPTG
jgi:hydrogenase-4 membrane subunit HyfE